MAVIALGNGTACRETESVISAAIASGKFLPLDIKYTIVNEDGSSVYSVSDIAGKELPSLDQNLRSAGMALADLYIHCYTCCMFYSVDSAPSARPAT